MNGKGKGKGKGEGKREGKGKSKGKGKLAMKGKKGKGKMIDHHFKSKTGTNTKHDGHDSGSRDDRLYHYERTGSIQKDMDTTPMSFRRQRSLRRRRAP